MPTRNAPTVNQPRQEMIDHLSNELQTTGKARLFPLCNVPDDDDPERMHPDWRTAGAEARAALDQIGALGKTATAGRTNERHVRITVVKDAYAEISKVVRKNNDSWSADSRPLRDYTYETLDEAYADAYVKEDKDTLVGCAFEMGYRGKLVRGRTSVPEISERFPEYLRDVCPTCQSPVAELTYIPRPRADGTRSKRPGKKLGIRSINSADSVRREWADLIGWTPEYYMAKEKAILKSYQENGAPEGAVPPFFSEVTLYELLGKDEARSLLRYLRSLGKALGFTLEEL